MSSYGSLRQHWEFPLLGTSNRRTNPLTPHQHIMVNIDGEILILQEDTNMYQPTYHSTNSSSHDKLWSQAMTRRLCLQEEDYLC